MSLRVWLPLTKDLRNQGLDDVTIINNGATFDANGKLGGCYYFNRSAPNYLKITNPLTTATNGVSMAFWVKLPSNGSVNDQLVHIGNGSGWTNNRFTCFVRGGNSTLIFACGDGTNSTQYSCVSSALTLNQWTHVVCLYENNKMKIYLNGALNKEYSTTIVPSFTNVTYIGIGAGPNVTEPATAYLNDVRIYDHALSPLEIKHISQGLVLHYPLSDAYMEATTNLSNSKLSNSCYNAATQKYSYGTNTDIYKESGTFEGRICEKIHMGTDGLDAFPYVFFDYFQPPIGETRTLSFDYYPTIMDKIIFYTYGSYGSGNYTVNYKAPVSWSVRATIPVQLNQWSHITITVTNTGSTANGYGYMQIGDVKHTSNTANYWLFGNIQVEAKDHATGYAGPNGTRNTSIVYDTSGYGNNGTIVGSLGVDNDTPKYKISTVFNGVDNCIQIGNWYTLFQNPFTINVWFKKDEIGSKSYETLFGGASGFEIDTRAGNSQTLSLYLPSPRGVNAYSPFNLNQWYMVTMVSDGINEEFYVDGILRKTIEKKAMTNSVYRIGAWNSDTSQNFKGQMSDFRIYATALSADDVLDLYHTSAYVDDNNNLYVNELSEVTT